MDDSTVLTSGLVPGGRDIYLQYCTYYYDKLGA